MEQMLLNVGMLVGIVIFTVSATVMYREVRRMRIDKRAKEIDRLVMASSRGRYSSLAEL